MGEIFRGDEFGSFAGYQQEVPEAEVVYKFAFFQDLLGVSVRR